MSDSPAPTTDAILLLLLRIAALAIAVMGVMASGGLFLMGDSAGITPADIGIAIAAIVAIEVLAVGVWLRAPRLARRFVIAEVDGRRATDVAALAFALLGLWFLGTGIVELVAIPVRSWVASALGASTMVRDVIGDAFTVSYVVGELVRIAFGATLLLKSRALAAWIAGPTAP